MVEVFVSTEQSVGDAGLCLMLVTQFCDRSAHTPTSEDPAAVTEMATC